MLCFLVFTHLFSRGNNSLGKQTCLDTGHKKRTRSYISKWVSGYVLRLCCHLPKTLMNIRH